VKELFINSENDLRAGWRFLLYVTVFLAVWVGTALLLSLFFAFGDFPVEIDLVVLALNAVALFVPSVVALVFMARFVDHVPASAFGTALNETWRRDLALGIGIATAMLVVMLAASFAFGRVDMQWAASTDSFFMILATAAVLFVSAANEELVFRGYPMQTLMKGFGRLGAIVFMSSLFGLLHWRNPDSTILSVLNTILAGVVLSISYLKARSLWLPYGIHVVWNVGLGVVVGIPVSGIELASLWTTRVEGSPVLLGGPYGPEGGLIGTMIFVGAMIALRAIRLGNTAAND
jgi:uncharacterized protein